MTRNDFYLGLGFIGMILSFGFHGVLFHSENFFGEFLFFSVNNMFCLNSF